jgi:hypothetical protein
MGYTADPDMHTAELAPKVTDAQIEQFHRDHVASNQRVWIVIGDRKLSDFNALRNYGKVVELHKEDVFR